MEPQTEPTAASITAGLLTRAKLASDLNRSERTIIRFEHAGMPVIKLGMLRFYSPSAVRDWLMTHESRPREQPRRGRPRKAA